MLFIFALPQKTGLRNNIYSSLDIYVSVEYGAEIANPNVKSIFHGKLEKK